MSIQSMPGRTTSSMYSPAPRMKRGSSLRLTEWPMPPTSKVVWSGVAVPSAVIVIPLARRGVDGCGRECGRTLGFAQRASCFLDRLDDVHIARAAAEIARDARTDFLFRGLRILGEQPC